MLEVRIETGRRHQIRVHLNSIGHPVLGDTRYGSDRPVGAAARLMLHAKILVLPGFSRRPLRFEAPLPSDFTAILRDFRL